MACSLARAALQLVMPTLTSREAAVASWAAGWVVLSCGLAACKRNTSPTGGEPQPAAGSAASRDAGVLDAVPVAPDWRSTVLPTNAPAAFAVWDLPGRAQAWQGAWLSQPGLGFFLAIEVAGARVTSWDGNVEKRLEFALESPCSAKFIEKSPAGESSSTTHFTVKAGKLWAGLGDAGSRKGKAAVVCAANVMLVLDESGRCTQYTPNFGNYRESAGHCALRSKAGGEVFTATVDGVAIELLVDGDAIYSTQLSKMPDRGYADFAAAKAAWH